jgi:hypothetical protein
MGEPSPSRRSWLIAPAVEQPDALDETVVHDPSGKPWLVCTIDMLWGLDSADPTYVEDMAELAGRFETQIFYTARAGVRGFPTGHGERYLDRIDAIAGHRRWCLKVRLGELSPDMPPEEPL